MKTKKVVYMVTYTDNRHKMHMTFVEGFSAVRCLEERFSNVYFETTNCYPHFKEEETEDDFEKLLKLMS